MRKTFSTFRCTPGFSLAEVLAALTIAAMVSVAVLGIYNRAERSAAAIVRRLDDSRLPNEVLQRIAEDLDKVLAAGNDTKILIRSKLQKGYQGAQLKITRTIKDQRNKEQTFEEITWQTSYDYDTDSLVLYRSHSGINFEDRLLYESREDWERELFIPICEGVTFFSILVPKGETFLNQWPAGTLPAGIVITISFAEPYEAIDGSLDVTYEQKISRNIAVDRTRSIKFEIIKRDYTPYAEDVNEPFDYNEPADANERQSTAEEEIRAEDDKETEKKRLLPTK